MGDLQLAARVGVVTGGGTGIGRAISTYLAGVGADVIVADIDLGIAAKTADEIGGRGGTATTVRIDVNNAAGLDPLVDHLQSRGRHWTSW